MKRSNPQARGSAAATLAATAILALTTYVANPPAAYAGPNALDVIKTFDAYLDCGYEFVKRTPVPTVAAAHLACDGKLTPYLEAVRFTTELTEPRIATTPEVFKANVDRRVAETRQDAWNKFSREVSDWIKSR